MKTAFVLWTVVFLIFGTIIFTSVWFQRNKVALFDDMCGVGKVCTLYPDQIDMVIAAGKNVVVFFYHPSCNASKKIQPVLERLCTRVKDTVFCQILCDANDKNKGSVQAYHDSNFIDETSSTDKVKGLVERLRLL